jgi:hypothetical protein
MALKEDEQKKDAVILDFREAYVRKQMRPEFRDLTDRIKKLKHSERAMHKLLEDLRVSYSSDN